MSIKEKLKNISPDLITQAKKVKDISEFKNFLKENKINLSEQEVNEVFYFILSGKQKLNPDELESVSGGKGKTKETTTTEDVSSSTQTGCNNKNTWNMHN